MTWFQPIFRRHRFYDDSAEALSEQRRNEVRQWPTLESTSADTRFALRQMRKAPAFTFTVVLLLGLGIAIQPTTTQTGGSPGDGGVCRNRYSRRAATSQI